MTSILVIMTQYPLVMPILLSPDTLQVQEVVSRVEAGGLLPPLVVLQSLGRNPSLRLDLVKDYITRQLQAEHRWVAVR